MKKLAPAVALALFALTYEPASAWFIWIPTGQIQGAIEGNHCVSETAKEGDRISAQGREWIVKSVSGVSSRCAGTPQWPVIAKLEPVLTDSELRQIHTICAGQGVQVGNRTTIPGLGEVEVRSISLTGCSDTRAPVAANVVRLQSSFVQAALARLRALPSIGNARTSTPPVAEPAVTPPTPASGASRSAVERLRELKQLRDENLITDSVYEQRQREILREQ